MIPIAALLARLLAKKAAKSMARKLKPGEKKKLKKDLTKKGGQVVGKEQAKKALAKKKAEKQIAKKGKKEAKKAIKKAVREREGKKAVIGGLRNTIKKGAKEVAKIGCVLATGAAIGKAIPDGPIDKKNKRIMEEEKEEKKTKEKKERSVFQKRKELISGAAGSGLSIAARQEYLLTGDIPKKRKRPKQGAK